MMSYPKTGLSVFFLFLLSFPVRAQDEATYTVDRRVHDYGEITLKENHRTVFVVTNHSEAPLVIRKAKTSCTCTKVNFSRKPVRKGETSDLEVIYNTKEEGAFYKEIELLTDAVPQTAVIAVRGMAVSGRP